VESVFKHAALSSGAVPYSQLYHAFRILHPSSYTHTLSLDAKSKMSAQFILLVDFYTGKKVGEKKLFIPPRADIGATNATAKQGVLTSHAKLSRATVLDTPSITLQSFWQQASATENYPHVFQLARVMMVLPVQSATVERGFSMHRVIKHRLTNRLELVTLDSLMRVHMLGPKTDEVSLDDFTNDTINASVQTLLPNGMRGATSPFLLRTLFYSVCSVTLPTTLLRMKGARTVVVAVILRLVRAGLVRCQKARRVLAVSLE
jgi:hypothetical protein